MFCILKSLYYEGSKSFMQPSTLRSMKNFAFISQVALGFLDGNRLQVKISKLENIFKLNTTNNTKAEYIVISIQSIFSQE